MSREPIHFLEDIESACSNIIKYSCDLTQDEVFSDQMRLDAILMNFHIIGEAVKNLPNDTRERYSDVPWRRISGMRDFVAHVYFALDLDIVWDTICTDVPELLDRVRGIIADQNGQRI